VGWDLPWRWRDRLKDTQTKGRNPAASAPDDSPITLKGETQMWFIMTVCYVASQLNDAFYQAEYDLFPPYVVEM
jgi:hypothetical protein